MGRKRTEWGPTVEARIRDLKARGGTARSISEALKREGVQGASMVTVHRRLKEMANGTSPPSSGALPSASPTGPPPSDVELPTAPEEIPQGTDMATFDRWIENVEKMAAQAEFDKNFVELGKAGRLMVMLLDAKRKAAPPERPDPNDNPDLKALAEDVAKRLHNLVDQVTGE